MWGGFDLANISQFGNQLGEALQRAKHELDTKLDQTFAFDDKPSARNSESANDDGDNFFTVDAGGLLLSTGHEASKQPTAQDNLTSVEQQQHSAAGAELAAPVGAEQSALGPDELQASQSIAETTYGIQEGSKAAAPEAPSSKQVKKKLVRKVVHKPKAVADAAAADSIQEQLAAAGEGSIANGGGNTAANGHSSTAGSIQAPADDAEASTAGEEADAETQAWSNLQQQHGPQPEQQRGAKKGKGLEPSKLGLLQPEQQSDWADLQQQQQQAGGQKWLAQPAEEPKPAHQQHSDFLGQTQSKSSTDEQQQQDTASLFQVETAADGQQQARPQAQGQQLAVDRYSSSSSVQLAAQSTAEGQGEILEQQQLAGSCEQHPDLHVQEAVTHLQQQEAHTQHELQQQQEHVNDNEEQQHQEQPQYVEGTEAGTNTADGPSLQEVEVVLTTTNQQPSSSLQQQQQQLDADHPSSATEHHHRHQQQQQQQHSDHQISRLQQQCHQLQQQLQQREDQLARQAQRLGDLEAATSALSDAKAQLEQVVAALTAKNEQLVLRATRVNEQEMEELQQEAAGRLAAAERKVFALIKERDALKRAAAAAAGDGSSDAKRLEADLRKKDELVVQLMDEGEKLSKRQLELESAVKKLRQQLKASETDKEKLNALLAAEQAEAEGLRRAKAKAERDLVAAVEAGRQQVETVRQQGEEQLLKAQAEKAAAEAQAAEAATEGLAGQLQSSEARASALAETVAELQEALDRHRATADKQEEALRQELSDLERRAQAAEVRHQELSAKLPEATAPLLRQITALQDAAAAQAQVWAAAERKLTARVYDAEAAAAAAEEREGEAQGRIAHLQSRLSAAEQVAAAAKSTAAEAATRAACADERLALTEQQLEDAQAAVQEVQAVADQLQEQVKQQEAAYKRKLGNEAAARRAAEEELTRTRQELSQLQGMMGPGVRVLGVQQNPGVGIGFGAAQPPDQQQSDMWRAAAGPPALAAPGFKWILVKEGADAASAAAAANGEDMGGSLPGTPHSTASAGAAGSKLWGQGSSASSAVAAGFFDTSELLQSDTASASGAVGLAGAASGGTALSPASSGVLQLHQAQLRAAQQRLGGGSVSEAHLHKLRAALRQKVGECAALQARVRELEDTRDQLAEELVRATQDAKHASDAVAELPRLQQVAKELEARYAAAVELVGERDEQLEELANDLEDVKQLYRQQIETLLAQVAETD